MRAEPLPSGDESRLLSILGEPLRSRYLNARDEKERRSVISDAQADNRARLWAVERDMANSDEHLAILKRRIDAWEEIKETVSKPASLQRLNEGAAHRLFQSLQEGNAILPVDDVDAVRDENLKWFPEPGMAIFLVQHNWASALERADGFSDGDFRLPYSEQAFEFRISGHRVICFAGAEDGLCKGAIFYMETSVGWAMIGYTDDKWTPHIDGTEICAPILNLARDQVRAITIALEAELAITEVIRAPHKLNAKRLKAGKVPLFDSHVVHLANRRKYETLPVSDHDFTPRRLHFVRGHWRHYETRKAWIKWHLRGNPDLGFIEKEYRL